MLSSELEFCLNEAFQKARDQRHEFMTVEHLLVALMDIPRIHEVLKACGSNISELRRQLIEFIDEQTPLLAVEDDTEPEEAEMRTVDQPTQSVISLIQELKELL